ncbi:MAG: GNAT family N-acetyltransferase [Anaerolineae bacterium]|nr:GNAT family N-acetyltransferase [Gemmatimonadaceae bacterium]
MAVSRVRSLSRVTGPMTARADDISALNTVFSDAFTDRYRRDGMTGVRVPYLNPSIWLYSVEDAAGGALIWRDERDDIVAFNMVHQSGVEGWMGPLSVRPDRQGRGLGKEIVRAGVERLKANGATTIGLETMPRTMDNIGFYSALGFIPGPLTITLTLEATVSEKAPYLLGSLSRADKKAAIAQCGALTSALMPGYDFGRELMITDTLGIGDTVLMWRADRVVGVALCHCISLVEGRAAEEMRVLKLVLEREADLEPFARTLADFARRRSAQRVALRVQTEYLSAYERLVAMGARVRWTDLRMTLRGFGEARAKGGGLVWSNWEI